jgi:CHAT domain-containing protein
MFTRSTTVFFVLLVILFLFGGCTIADDASKIINDESTPAFPEDTSAEVPFISSNDPALVKAHVLIGAGRLYEAKTLVVHGRHADNSLSKVESLCTLSELLIRMGDYEAAGARLFECKEQALKHTNNHSIRAYVFHLLGYLEHVRGNYIQALSWYEKALGVEVLIDHDDNAAFLNTLNNLGNVKYRLGDYDSARSIHLEVLAGRINIYGQQHQKVAGTLGNLGNAYQASGMPEMALRYHKSALDIWKKTVDPASPQLAYTHDNIGLASTDLGKYETALFHLNSAMSIKLKSQSRKTASIASTHLLLSKALLGIQDTQRAKSHIRFSIAIFEELDLTSLPKYSLSQNILSKVLALEGEYSSALDIINSEIRRLDSNYNPTISALYLTKAELCYALNNFQCSLQASMQSIDFNTGINGAGASESLLLLKDASNPERLFEALKGKAKSLIKLAELNRSPVILNRAFETLEILLTLSNASQLGLLSISNNEKQSSGLDTELADFISIGIDLLEEVSDEQLDRRIFVATDMYLGGQLLSELLSSDENDSPKGAGPQKLITPSFSGTNHLAPNDSSNDDFDLLAELEEASPNINGQSNISETFRLLNGLVLPSVSPGQSIVEYVNVKGRIIAFVINNEGVSTTKLGNTSNVVGRKEEVLAALRKNESDRFIDLSVSLYQELLAPISELIGNDDLLIIPHDVTSGIPFELLLSPESLKNNPPSPSHRLPYLIRSRSVSYGYSVAQIVHNAKKSESEYSRDFLGIAPVFDQELEFSPEVASFLNKNVPNWETLELKLQALPGTELEVLEIADILESKSLDPRSWGNRNTELFIRDAVSESKFKSLDLSRFRFVHIATHGFADPDNPANSGILMETDSSAEDDGVLFAHEVADLEINSELVVLSSCDSAVETGMGSEISGLAKSFLYAGSRNVVASIWPSDDVGTRILMRILYAYMAEGHAVDEALRLAKLDLLEMGGPIANPYYWAGFIHIGAPSGIRKAGA